MKKNFQKFFEKLALKQNMIYFKQWRSYCEFERYRIAEYQVIKKFLETRENYYQSLRDEK